MNFGARRLDTWLTRNRHTYSRVYDSIVARLAGIHGAVVALARVAEEEYIAENPGAPPVGFLTDHGPEHISRVIDRATDLLRARDAKITEREAFMLLVAIQIHDTGNMFGRRRHEERVKQILRQVKQDDLDDVESHAIIKIAEAHGGHQNGNKDKIGLIQPVEHFHNDEVRLRFLAALLRFADELSDDASRSSRYLSDLGVIPSSSEVYHAYAQSLKSVRVNPDTNEIALTYVLDRAAVTRKFGKETSSVYLLDYIYERTLKMHYERIYCSRFLTRNGIDIERVRVAVRFLDNDEEFRTPIPYELADTGYPTEDQLASVCPDLQMPDGSLRWTGASLHAEVQGAAQGGTDV